MSARDCSNRVPVRLFTLPHISAPFCTLKYSLNTQPTHGPRERRKALGLPYACPALMSHPPHSLLDMDDLSVETVDGVPVSFVREGCTWHVAIRPEIWFERTRWWETMTRMPRNAGVWIDVMVCQVQARIGHNPKSDLVTFELVLGTDRQTWTCRSMVAI